MYDGDKSVYTYQLRTDLEAMRPHYKSFMQQNGSVYSCFKVVLRI